MGAEERGFAVLVEQVRSEVRRIAEGLVGLEDRVNQRFQLLERKIDTGFTDVHTALRALATRLDEHTH